MERVRIRLTFVNNDGTLGKDSLSKNIIKIGRDISNQIRLKNPAALKLHCKIKVDKSAVCKCINYSAEHPVQVNHVPIEKHHDLKHNDVVTVLGSSFLFEFASSGARKSDASAKTNVEEENARKVAALKKVGGQKRKTTFVSSLMAKRRRSYKKRITVHEFAAIPTVSEESPMEEDDSTEQSFSNTETPKTPTKLSCVPCKVDSPNKENLSSPLKGLGQLSMSLNYSGTLTTSYTPDARLRKLVETPNSCYGTPKSVLSERNVSLHFMRVDENSTPVRAAARNLQEVRKTMHLIDLTTPQVNKTPKNTVKPSTKLPNNRNTPQSTTPKTAKKRNLIDLTTPENYRTPVGQKAGSLLKSALKNTAGRTPATLTASVPKKPKFALDDPAKSVDRNAQSTSKVTGSPKVAVKRHSCALSSTSTPISSRTLLLRTPRSQNKQLNLISEGKAELIVQSVKETSEQVSVKMPVCKSDALKPVVEIVQQKERRIIKLGTSKETSDESKLRPAVDDFEGIEPLDTQLQPIEGIEPLQSKDLELLESVEESTSEEVEPTKTDETEEPPITGDQTFDKLAGNPIIKYTYARRSNSLSPAKVAHDPVVKQDVSEWIHNVQATTSAPPKTPNTVQILSSRYSNITPHEPSVEPDTDAATPQLDKSVISFKKVYTTLKTPRTPEATTVTVNRLSLTPLNRMSISSVGHVDELEPTTTNTTPLLQKSMRSTRKRIGSAFMFLNTSNFNESSFNHSICSENVDGECDTVEDNGVEENLNATFTLTEDIVDTVKNERQSIEDSEVLAEVLPDDRSLENADCIVEQALESVVNDDQVKKTESVESEQSSEHLQKPEEAVPIVEDDLPTGSEATVIEETRLCEEPTKYEEPIVENYVSTTLPELVVPIRPNARRKSAIFSKVEPSPIKTRRSSRKTIESVESDQPSEHLQKPEAAMPIVEEDLPTGSEEPIVENYVSTNFPELVVPLRPNARRKSAIFSKVQPSPIKTKRNSRKTIASASEVKTSELDNIVEDSVPVSQQDIEAIIETEQKAPETPMQIQQSATSSKVQPIPITKRSASTGTIEAKSSLLNSSDLESITEVFQPTPDPVNIEIELEIPASLVKTEIDQIDTIALSVETPKAIRHSARRRSATPSNVLASPITTRRDSRQTIATVSQVKCGDLESITEVVHKTHEEAENETGPENNVTVTETMNAETPKAIRQSARRKSTTPSKVLPNPITTRRVSSKKTEIGDLESITEIVQTIPEAPEIEDELKPCASPANTETDANDTTALSVETPKAIRLGARRQSGTPSKVQLSLEPTRRGSSKTIESGDQYSKIEVVQPAHKENTDIEVQTMRVETPKAIRQSTRRLNATPSKVQPNPITTRRDSSKEIASVSFVRSGDLESITEVVRPTREAIEIEHVSEITDIETNTINVETPKTIRKSARRRSATPSKPQPSPITTRRNSRTIAAVSAVKSGDLAMITEIEQMTQPPTQEEINIPENGVDAPLTPIEEPMVSEIDQSTQPSTQEEEINIPENGVEEVQCTSEKAMISDQTTLPSTQEEIILPENSVETPKSTAEEAMISEIDESTRLSTQEEILMPEISVKEPQTTTEKERNDKLETQDLASSLGVAKVQQNGEEAAEMMTPEINENEPQSTTEEATNDKLEYQHIASTQVVQKMTSEIDENATADQTHVVGQDSASQAETPIHSDDVIILDQSTMNDAIAENIYDTNVTSTFVDALEFVNMEHKTMILADETTNHLDESCAPKNIESLYLDADQSVISKYGATSNPLDETSIIDSSIGDAQITFEEFSQNENNSTKMDPDSSPMLDATSDLENVNISGIVAVDVSLAVDEPKRLEEVEPDTIDIFAETHNSSELPLEHAGGNDMNDSIVEATQQDGVESTVAVAWTVEDKTAETENAIDNAEIDDELTNVVDTTTAETEEEREILKENEIITVDTITEVRVDETLVLDQTNVKPTTQETGQLEHEPILDHPNTEQISEESQITDIFDMNETSESFEGENPVESVRQEEKKIEQESSAADRNGNKTIHETDTAEIAGLDEKIIVIDEVGLDESVSTEKEPEKSETLVDDQLELVIEQSDTDVEAIERKQKEAVIDDARHIEEIADNEAIDTSTVVVFTSDSYQRNEVISVTEDKNESVDEETISEEEIENMDIFEKTQADEIIDQDETDEENTHESTKTIEPDSQEISGTVPQTSAAVDSELETSKENITVAAEEITVLGSSNESVSNQKTPESNPIEETDTFEKNNPTESNENLKKSERKMEDDVGVNKSMELLIEERIEDEVVIEVRPEEDTDKFEEQKTMEIFDDTQVQQIIDEDGNIEKSNTNISVETTECEEVVEPKSMKPISEEEIKDKVVVEVRPEVVTEHSDNIEEEQTIEIIDNTRVEKIIDGIEESNANITMEMTEDEIKITKPKQSESTIESILNDSETIELTTVGEVVAVCQEEKVEFIVQKHDEELIEEVGKIEGASEKQIVQTTVDENKVVMTKSVQPEHEKIAEGEETPTVDESVLNDSEETEKEQEFRPKLVIGEKDQTQEEEEAIEIVEEHTDTIVEITTCDIRENTDDEVVDISTVVEVEASILPLAPEEIMVEYEKLESNRVGEAENIQIVNQTPAAQITDAEDECPETLAEATETLSVPVDSELETSQGENSGIDGDADDEEFDNFEIHPEQRYSRNHRGRSLGPDSGNEKRSKKSRKTLGNLVESEEFDIEKHKKELEEVEKTNIPTISVEAPLDEEPGVFHKKPAIRKRRLYSHADVLEMTPTSQQTEDRPLLRVTVEDYLKLSDDSEESSSKRSKKSSKTRGKKVAASVKSILPTLTPQTDDSLDNPIEQKIAIVSIDKTAIDEQNMPEADVKLKLSDEETTMEKDNVETTKVVSTENQRRGRGGRNQQQKSEMAAPEKPVASRVRRGRKKQQIEPSDSESQESAETYLVPKPVRDRKKPKENIVGELPKSDVEEEMADTFSTELSNLEESTHNDEQQSEEMIEKETAQKSKPVRGRKTLQTEEPIQEDHSHDAKEEPTVVKDKATEEKRVRFNSVESVLEIENVLRKTEVIEKEQEEDAPKGRSRRKVPISYKEEKLNTKKRRGTNDDSSGSDDVTAAIKAVEQVIASEKVKEHEPEIENTEPVEIKVQETKRRAKKMAKEPESEMGGEEGEALKSEEKVEEIQQKTQPTSRRGKKTVEEPTNVAPSVSSDKNIETTEFLENVEKSQEKSQPAKRRGRKVVVKSVTEESSETIGKPIEAMESTENVEESQQTKQATKRRGKKAVEKMVTEESSKTKDKHVEAIESTEKVEESQQKNLTTKRRGRKAVETPMIEVSTEIINKNDEVTASTENVEENQQKSEPTKRRGRKLVEEPVKDESLESGEKNIEATASTETFEVIKQETQATKRRGKKAVELPVVEESSQISDTNVKATGSKGSVEQKTQPTRRRGKKAAEELVSVDSKESTEHVEENIQETQTTKRRGRKAIEVPAIEVENEEETQSTENVEEGQQKRQVSRSRGRKPVEVGVVSTETDDTMELTTNVEETQQNTQTIRSRRNAIESPAVEATKTVEETSQKSQPTKRRGKKAVETLASEVSSELSDKNINETADSEGSSRPRRKAMPTSLMEEKLNTKKRRGISDDEIVEKITKLSEEENNTIPDHSSASAVKSETEDSQSEEDSNQAAGRPRRKAMPGSMKEEKLNTKKRRQDAELQIDGKTVTVSLTIHDSQPDDQPKSSTKERAGKKGMFDNVTSSTPMRAQRVETVLAPTPQPAQRTLRSQSVMSNASVMSNTAEVVETSKRRGRKLDTTTNVSAVEEPPKKKGRAVAKKNVATAAKQLVEVDNAEVPSTSRGRRAKKPVVEEEPNSIEILPPPKAKRGRGKQTPTETVENKEDESAAEEKKPAEKRKVTAESDDGETQVVASLPAKRTRARK